MPSEIMDDYLSDLDKVEKRLIGLVITPFEFTAAILADVELRKERLHTKEVSLGPVTVEIQGESESDLAELEKHTKEQADSIISTIANAEFETEFLNADLVCILPSIGLIRELHDENLVFGFLIAAHDEHCEACGTNSDENFDEREEKAANDVAALSHADQQSLVEWAKRFLDATLNKKTASQRRNLFEELEALSIPSCDGTCFFQPNVISEENISWLAQSPYFFQNMALHAGTCKDLREILLKFERALVEQLSEKNRSLYQESVFIFTHGDSHLLFE